MPAPELLLKLLSASGPSGHESEAAKVWRDGCASFAQDVGADHLGSSFARIPGTAGGPTLAVVGHIDEIGLHVSHIEDAGYLRFGQVGGWDPGVLIGQRVRLNTRNGPITGVIGRKPIHLLKDDDRKKVPELKELHIDIGAKDAEETTFAGARTSAFAHEPDVAIVVDLTFATDQPGIELGEITKHTLDSGPVIARGTTLHPTVFELLHRAGEENEIPFSVESLGRGTGTDADAIHLSRAGIPTGLVSVPCRYMHSPVEMVSAADVDAAARLIAAFAKLLEPGMTFTR